jgi:hypothetical protein
MVNPTYCSKGMRVHIDVTQVCSFLVWSDLIVIRRGLTILFLSVTAKRDTIEWSNNGEMHCWSRLSCRQSRRRTMIFSLSMIWLIHIGTLDGLLLQVSKVIQLCVCISVSYCNYRASSYARRAGV